MSWKRSLDPIAKKAGFYLAYELDNSEFVGYLKNDVGTGDLKAIGYERPPRFLGVSLTAAKIHPKTGETHQFTFRKIDPEDNTRQFHIHGWWNDGRARLASHGELRPDFRVLPGETLSDAKERLQTHYRPEGDEYVRGATCKELEGLLE